MFSNIHNSSSITWWQTLRMTYSQQNRREIFAKVKDQRHVIFLTDEKDVYLCMSVENKLETEFMWNMKKVNTTITYTHHCWETVKNAARELTGLFVRVSAARLSLALLGHGTSQSSDRHQVVHWRLGGPHSDLPSPLRGPTRSPVRRFLEKL